MTIFRKKSDTVPDKLPVSKWRKTLLLYVQNKTKLKKNNPKIYSVPVSEQLLFDVRALSFFFTMKILKFKNVLTLPFNSLFY